MSKRMLIDASHREETRVVVLDGQKVEEFDFEAASKRPLKGNIYLAKVTRVEPSLQAAFVEYGGNRQGFLAFTEIHPDYYQIPVADRQALLEEQQREARRHAEEEGFEAVETGTAVVSDEELEAEEQQAESANGENSEGAAKETASGEESGEDEVFDNRGGASAEDDDEDEDEEGDEAESEVESGFNASQADLGGEHDHDEHDGNHHDENDDGEHGHDIRDDNPLGAIAEEEAEEGIVDQQTISEAGEAPQAMPHGEEHEHHHSDAQFSIVDPQMESDQGIVDEQAAAESGVSAPTDQPSQALRAPRTAQRFMRRKHYKIQEVIKRRQIMLVQVVKEERGNKGAALTTYMSLAGRYCVLMPNTPRGGGISRKITNANDRKRLKAAAAALDLPQGMGLIIRTAGEARTKLEIKRDYEYLLRMWDQIRELTLQSNAPACVYEEGDLIKRAIRDLYNKDVTEVIVEGDEGYHNAKDFMRMLMPSHAKNVKPYKDTVPLFQRQHIEAQLDSMFQPTVTLKSGGYIVINQTEALVSIDVNSGRATREHSIEETAHKTNLEAADEVGRQLRLRDLAGLIVIDFIDMEDSRNDRHVEKRLRDAVKNDRARVQIGKISQFGLMEMSRQRLRAGVVAGSTIPCPHCGGQGIVRSVESTALRVLRGLEEEGQKQRASAVTVKVTPDVAIYALNKKRQEIARLEAEYVMAISFEPDARILTGAFEIERTAHRAPDETPRPVVSPEVTFAEAPSDIAEAIEETETVEEEAEVETENETEQRETRPVSGDQSQRGEDGKRRKRRRRRGGRDREFAPAQNGSPAPVPAAFENSAEAVSVPSENGGEELPQDSTPRPQQNGEAFNREGQNELGADGQPRRRRRRRGRRGRRDGNEKFGQQNQNNNVEAGDAGPREPDATGVADSHRAPNGGGAPVPVLPNAESAPVWSLSGKSSATREPERVATPSPEAKPVPQPEQPVRKGWWQRTFAAKD